MGGSIRLEIEGDADARFTWGEACADGVPFDVLAGRDCAISMTAPRTGS